MRYWLFIFPFILLSACNSHVEPPKLEIREGCDEGQLLLGTAYNSFEEFQNCIDVIYSDDNKSMVTLVHYGRSQASICDLNAGVSEKDLLKANSSSIIAKIKLIIKEPMLIADRVDLQRAYLLSRRRPVNFGANDVAFYDLATALTMNIDKEHLGEKYSNDFSEKGFINTFNHFVSQAFITTLFSRRLADFIADAHELGRLPELTTGQFSKSQLDDLKNGPVDNYVDLLNNEWGQSFGERMRSEYNIVRASYWTPELMSNYLNEVQSYASKAFDIGFDPFRPSDAKVIRFADKINGVMFDFNAHSENLF